MRCASRTFQPGVWYGTSRRHVKLDGTVAITSSEVIADWLMKSYLREMMRPRIADAFDRWRLGQYIEHGLDEEHALVEVRDLQIQLIERIKDKVLLGHDYDDGVLPRPFADD